MKSEGKLPKVSIPTARWESREQTTLLEGYNDKKFDSDPIASSNSTSPVLLADKSAPGSTLFVPNGHGFRPATPPWRDDDSAAAGLAKVDPSVVGVLAQVEAQQIRSSARKRHAHLSERASHKRAPVERLISKLQQKKQKNEQKIAFLDKARNVPQWMCGEYM